ncbi:MAG: transcription termination/antitermination NusG family protein [Gemmatimonadaceae bacterium]
MSCGTELCWQLLYTKPNAETWVEINLRRQGYATLYPQVRGRSGLKPLFPRYIFAGFLPERSSRPLRSTMGVLYVVHCGAEPTRVPHEVIAEVRERMDEWGVVTLEQPKVSDPLFDRRERERLRALVKLAAAGFRVRVA